jgi:hypothetical protein
MSPCSSDPPGIGTVVDLVAWGLSLSQGSRPFPTEESSRWAENADGHVLAAGPCQTWRCLGSAPVVVGCVRRTSVWAVLEPIGENFREPRRRRHDDDDDDDDDGWRSM